MKLKHVILPAIAGLVIGQASVQGQTYEEKGSDVIDPGVDFYEEYVNRVMEEDYQPNSNGSVVFIGSDFGASYTAKNINITNADHDDTYSGIDVQRGNKYINLSAVEGTWNTITVKTINTDPVWAVALNGTMSETSTISNTRMFVSGSLSGGGLGVFGESVVVLDNIEIDVTDVGVGIFARDGGVVTNAGKRGVSVTANLSNFGSTILASMNGSTIELFDSTITALGSNAYAGVLSGQNDVDSTGDNTISLTNSTISSDAGNNLIADISGVLNVNLNKVDLTNAKGQNLLVDAVYGNYDVVLNLNLSNGTALDGSASTAGTATNTAESNIAITSGASWNVTQNSVLGDLTEGLGSLSLDGSSMICFEELSEGTFTNITSAAIALEAGAILMLGADAATIEGWIEGNGGTYSTQLFVTETVFSNDGVVLMSSDGMAFEYTTDNLGTYMLTRILPPSIPEPTTGALCLATFGLLALRRKKIKN